ncbi:expressed unknown protein [Seminavis robusta]|uniref:BTB domain-containing protein n=1 Tax=Seminavis robusta TaxID=568900 RepID=A0A9N8H9I6_9STRA|nr:expressed unknown protein [Seminavis robusta]|eukprot:Sro118_g057850.1 n/a (314) ;mRNA; f:90403-91344
MFFSGYKEAQSNTVEIGFPGAILETTVEYLHTNKVAKLDTPKIDPLELAVSQFQTVLSLTDAAAYFDLPGLHQLTLKSIQRYLDSRPQLAFVILQASQEKSNSAEIEKMAIAKIQANIKECLNTTVIMFKVVDSSVVKKILHDNGIMSSLTAAQVFQLIQAWSDNRASSEATSAAKELIAKHVRLADIPPSQLSMIVESSGLVTKEQITATYKMQAIKMEEQLLHGFTGSSLLQWKGSKSKIFTLESEGYKSDCTDRMPIKAGKHQWTIDVKKDIYTHLAQHCYTHRIKRHIAATNLLWKGCLELRGRGLFIQ